ncbi:MAG: hypothetical protein HC822_19370 [Oscillochloris sp.]|nr:hypothetical protein [Oscillochloris sp.]
MLTLRVDVRDPDVSGDDGIESVTFFITRYEADGSTTPVYEKVELNRAYCLFGGDDENCPAIELGPAATWPGGAAITPGDYHVEIAIVAENPARFAFWNFDFVIE